MNVAIIGAGLIGAKRAESLVNSANLRFVCDTDEQKAKNLAEKYSAEFCTNINNVLINRKIDIMIIATTNNFLAPFTVASLKAGKHVLCEKPLGRTLSESLNIAKAAKESGKFVKTGFNHRFHPAVMESKRLIQSGEIGDIINIRARYGHGGRPGYENEWRCNKKISGGGELLDQGVHLIDLCRWFSGELSEVFGKVRTLHWPIEVEDNAFIIMTHKNDAISQCHVSWTNWKNIFSLEIFGTEGFLHMDGLGGSYGLETLTVGMRNTAGGPPLIQNESFPGSDESWRLEWEDFVHAIQEEVTPIGSLDDGLKANRIVDAIYESSRLNKPVELK